MPINAHPDFLAAEKEYLFAYSLEDKLKALKKMLALSPKHKGAENLNAQLKRRLAKLKYTKQKEIKKTSSLKKGIKKEDMRAVIIGETNTGKSLLLSGLTNAKPKISASSLEKYTTKKPIIGMIDYHGVQIQIIENPVIESEYYGKGLTNSADVLLIIVTDLEQIEKILLELKDNKTKKIIIFNSKKTTDERKLEATLKSKKYDYVVVNLNSPIKNWRMELEEVGGDKKLENLKEKIFKSFNKIRVYTKEPGKEKTQKPIILEPEVTIKEVAEKILHGFSKQIKEIKIWGQSSKFPGQVVGLKHKLKDLDIVEFKTR